MNFYLGIHERHIAVNHELHSRQLQFFAPLLTISDYACGTRQSKAMKSGGTSSWCCCCCWFTCCLVGGEGKTVDVDERTSGGASRYWRGALRWQQWDNRLADGVFGDSTARPSACRSSRIYHQSTPCQSSGAGTIDDVVHDGMAYPKHVMIG